VRNIFDTEMGKVRDTRLLLNNNYYILFRRLRSNFLYYKIYAARMHNIDGYKSEKGLLIFTTGKQIYQTFLIYDKKIRLIKY